jgi:hypothetical protein
MNSKNEVDSQPLTPEDEPLWWDPSQRYFPTFEYKGMRLLAHLTRESDLSVLLEIDTPPGVINIMYPLQPFSKIAEFRRALAHLVVEHPATTGMATTFSCTQRATQTASIGGAAPMASPSALLLASGARSAHSLTGPSNIRNMHAHGPDSRPTTDGNSMSRSRIVRAISVNTKVSQSEYETIRAEAAARGLCLSEWMRARLLTPERDELVLAEMIATRTIVVNALYGLAAQGQGLRTSTRN